jgi:hypothetical protein
MVNGVESNGIGEALGFEEEALSSRFRRLLGQVREAAVSSAKGTAVDRIESLLLVDGRELLRQVAEQGIQTAADEAEKKGRASARVAVCCGATRETRKES